MKVSKVDNRKTLCVRKNLGRVAPEPTTHSPFPTSNWRGVVAVYKKTRGAKKRYAARALESFLDDSSRRSLQGPCPCLQSTFPHETTTLNTLVLRETPETRSSVRRRGNPTLPTTSHTPSPSSRPGKKVPSHNHQDYSTIHLLLLNQFSRGCRARS